MKTLIALITLFSLQAYAADCTQVVAKAFKKNHPDFNVKSVTRNGMIQPGEDMSYLQGEIWNNEKMPLAIYEVRSFFMMNFGHVILADEKNCSLKYFFEVLAID